MLRRRLITVLTFCEGVLHRTKVFNPDYRYTQNFVDAWSIDEIVLLDVTRPGQGSRENFLEVVQRFARRAFVPITVGGGIRSLDDVRVYMANGADKVTVNTGAVDRPELITDIAHQYGTQCVVLSIDGKREADGSHQVYTEFGARPIGKTPADWAREGVERGAGEVLVTSIDKDGSLEGYDLDLCRDVAQVVNVPVLICGGAGAWKHFVDGFEQGEASAVCTANIYHFTENSIRSAKSYLANKGMVIRPS